MVLLTRILSCIFSMVASIFSPMPTFYTICKNMSNNKYQITPYFASVLNSMLGVYFFILKKDEGIIYLMTNIVGCVAGCFYLGLYVVYATPEEKAFMKIRVFIFNLVVPAIVILGTNFVYDRVLAAEWMYGGSTVFLYAAPFMILVEVVEFQSVEYMPFILSGLALTRGVASAAYAINTHDTLATVIHSIGCGFGAAQLIIYYYVKKLASKRARGQGAQAQGGEAA